MNALHQTYPGLLDFDPPNESARATLPALSEVWDPPRFAQEQLSALVRRVFSPGWPLPSKQVVFTAVHSTHDIGPLCRRIAETLVSQVPGTVCLVEADSRSLRLELACAVSPPPDNTQQPASTGIHGRASRLADNLYLLPATDLAAGPECSSASLRSRLKELRNQFDFTIIHAPPVASFSETRLLAHLADGAVLVVNAQATRRLAACRARDLLVEANARLIGSVLDMRRFPIPEAIYRRL